jgi:hypothetical protein
VEEAGGRPGARGGGVPDHQAAEAAVADQDVGAQAEDEVRHCRFARGEDGGGEVVGAGGGVEEVGGPADPERRMRRERGIALEARAVESLHVPGWERRADNGNSWLRFPAFFTTGSCARHEISRMTTDLAHLAHDRRVRAALPGLCLAVLTLLFGFGLGIVFGFNEDLIRDRQRAAATAVLATAYQGDAAKVQPVLDKSWAYMQRAHLHAGSLGTSALALSGLVLLLGVSVGLTRAITLALGLGGLGYSSYWLLAGFRAPGMGGTGAAKESLKWLAMPSSGMFVVATALVAVLCLAALFRPRTPAGASVTSAA